MTIVTGFVGMSQDTQGFVRPQIGWSIHAFDSTPEKVKERKKQKKGPPIPNYPFNQIEDKSRMFIVNWAESDNVDISHLTKA